MGAKTTTRKKSNLFRSIKRRTMLPLEDRYYLLFEKPETEISDGDWMPEAKQQTSSSKGAGEKYQIQTAM